MKSKYEYPVTRKKIYVFLLALNLCLRIFMYFVVIDQSIYYHVIVSILSLVEIILLWEFIVFIGAQLESKLPILQHTFIRIFIQIVLTYGLSVGTGELIFFLIRQQFTATFQPGMQAIIHLLYLMLIIVINLTYFGVIYVFNWKNDLVKLANAERQQALIRYDALKNQLNPHFLFNALTSVNSLIREDADLAQNFLQQLTKVYRYVLQNKDKATVSISTELDFIKNFTALLKTRFATAIEFSIEVSDDAQDRAIVPVTLQILVENAVKHNVASSAQPLKISISNNDSFLIVENRINRKSSVESSNNQGMSNLKSLYQFLASEPIQISDRDNIFTVKIPLI